MRRPGWLPESRGRMHEPFLERAADPEHATDTTGPDRYLALGAFLVLRAADNLFTPQHLGEAPGDMLHACRSYLDDIPVVTPEVECLSAVVKELARGALAGSPESSLDPLIRYAALLAGDARLPEAADVLETAIGIQRRATAPVLEAALALAEIRTRMGEDAAAIRRWATRQARRAGISAAAPAWSHAALPEATPPQLRLVKPEPPAP